MVREVSEGWSMQFGKDFVVKSYIPLFYDQLKVHLVNNISYYQEQNKFHLAPLMKETQIVKNPRTFIFGKHNNNYCSNGFWKFAYKRIINVEVI